ncbi:hypothetical protein [Streptomyces sp. NPDC005302]|uniref:hypothetical protein n=1 Tax=Streptomyces sp. NPDC005302 TaxID=3154675 RepID=UPI0033A06B4C
MTGVLIYDAIDTASLLINVIWLWCLTAAAAVTALLALTAVSMRAAWMAVRRGVVGAQSAAHATPAPASTETAPEPHTPAWAHRETEAA